jgi:cell division GTPase FtsZ
MKLLVIGIGDCGCRIAREFAELNRVAKSERHVDIITCAYGINNEEAVLEDIAGKSPPETFKPVPIRGSLAMDKSSDAGARIMRQEAERVMLALRLGAFVETDAFMLVASAGGTLGSGGISVLAQLLKERRAGKPVYALIVLPFDSELDDPRIVQNSAVCVKSISRAADAVILVDNGGLGTETTVMPVEAIAKANKDIVYQFYDLLCAGEMAGVKYAGGKVLDAGDIVQTFAGWTSIGTGKAPLGSSLLPWKRTESFDEKSSETLRAIEAMNMALMHLSVDCKLEDAGRALFLLSAPPKQANVDMIKVLANRMKELAPNAELRNGSFYGAKNFVQVTVAVSELVYLDRVKTLYERAARLAGAAGGAPAE